jgi:fumarylacetoacetase
MMLFEIDKNSDFSIHNIPFGIFSTENSQKRLGTAIGDKVLDLKGLAELGFFNALDIPLFVFGNDYLNNFIGLGKTKTNSVRTLIQSLFQSDRLREYPHLWYNQQDVKLHLPVYSRDYTDFYSSQEHATNVGRMFRDPDNALLPNWKHLPVAYHGRASSLVGTGVDIYRPKGQVLPKGSLQPVFKATERLDFELETGFIIGKDSEQGSSVSTGEAENYIFGMVLLNDWSARDIQQWEYVPLGPFAGKNFATSVSPWVVTMEALEPFRVQGPLQDPEVLPYLKYEGLKNFDIHLQVAIRDTSGRKTGICRSNFKYMYWNMAQQLAHHTVNGCNMTTGDLMGSGTISGPDKDSFGSMLELTWNGMQPLMLNNQTERSFLLDHDTVFMSGYAEKEGVRVGFGELSNTILSAKG